MMTLYVILYMWMWLSQLYYQPTRLSCRSVVKINCRKCCNWPPLSNKHPQSNRRHPHENYTKILKKKSKSSKIIQFSHFVGLINKGFRFASCSVVKFKERIGKRLQHNDPEWGFWHRFWDLKERCGSLDGLEVSMDGLNILLSLLQKRLLSIKRPLLDS